MPYIGFSRPTPEQVAAEHAVYNARYHTLEPQWSFTLSVILDGSVDEVATKLGRFDGFETAMRLNPVCFEYKELARDWVVLPQGQTLSDARVREVPGCSANPGEDATITPGNVEGGRRYERIQFEAKDVLKAFWGLMSGVVIQRGTYVWDEDEKMGLWEVTNLDKPGMEAWLRKIIRFESVPEGGGVDGKGERTRVVEICEGYTWERLHLFEWLAERYTKDLHSNWMSKYRGAL
ncbi:hypothetical protein D9756_002174 [Leucocoprinus leucothites]|uniref:Uncharacterized protein n=1 Tax=Leucocoprinus leucothites TaxID=201217 RepID=A0A8H5LM53_9AGAR|nr:hypothetical protein D9756_002174 [Leucoagaricus leucothites]